MKKYIVTGSVVITLLLVLGIGQTLSLSSPTQVSAAARESNFNHQAPAFKLQGLEGNSYTVGGKRDKPLILNFWASWCGPCHEEAPDLKQVYEQHKDQIDFYAVNVTKGDGMSGVKGFVKQYGISFPVLLDKEGKAAELYRIVFVPTTFLIDRNGDIREVVHVLSREQWETKIKNLLET